MVPLSWTHLRWNESDATRRTSAQWVQRHSWCWKQRSLGIRELVRLVLFYMWLWWTKRGPKKEIKDDPAGSAQLWEKLCELRLVRLCHCLSLQLSEENMILLVWFPVCLHARWNTNRVLWRPQVLEWLQRWRESNKTRKTSARQDTHKHTHLYYYLCEKDVWLTPKPSMNFHYLYQLDLFTVLYKKPDPALFYFSFQAARLSLNLLKWSWATVLFSSVNSSLIFSPVHFLC